MSILWTYRLEVFVDRIIFIPPLWSKDMTIFISLTKAAKSDSFAIDDKYEDAVRNLLVTLEMESDKN